MSAEERAAYEQQLAIAREDFLQERADRDRVASRCSNLQMQVDVLKREYNELMTRYSSVANTRAFRANRFGSRLACDGGGSSADETEMETEKR